MFLLTRQNQIGQTIDGGLDILRFFAGFAKGAAGVAAETNLVILIILPAEDIICFDAGDAGNQRPLRLPTRDGLKDNSGSANARFLKKLTHVPVRTLRRFFKKPNIFDDCIFFNTSRVIE